MICENYRSNKTVTNCVCGITHSEREEHRITGHVLGTNSYRIPTSLIKYHANSINLLIMEYFRNNYTINHDAIHIHQLTKDNNLIMRNFDA